ncbi:sigma-54-dependent Fis family transcriptional regulator [Lysobacter sp. TY2-98]|uniref:sigma-54 dependent transcriptional regulator n=1 Tax=Lysobacter sp. TY2-98 TaxID=2290922 RepID=UPI000E202461|nr:sigma-54 dependent transcriptional regulator [Lysobacter sp. TY2-98]AXK73179.1 sigma-54-dependent Fis family transcriptional regulator [Lysobacter sp. TY2-98]
MADGGAGRDVVYVARAGRGTPPARLQQLGWKVALATDARSALRIVQRRSTHPFAALLDLRDGFSDTDLAEFGPVLAASNVGWVAGVSTEQLGEPAVRRLIRDYCYDYVTLPCPEGVLDTVIGHAHGMARLACESAVRLANDGLEGIIGESPGMKALARTLCKAANTEAPVFIAGETGTGKELAAQALHAHSKRRGMPFVAINCGAIPHSLIQSELFGYERGAFTGAQNRKFGRIEMANGGTLFLDEIGDLPMESQAALLRFLQEGTFQRLGGHDTIRVDVRIVSATHHDLQSAIAQGRFRADLYHRLCVLRVAQPPLRERGNDIDLLAQHALSRYSTEGQRVIKGFSPDARRALHAYDWPGNVRELINRVRQAVVMAEGRLITAADLGVGDVVAPTPPTLEEVRNDATRRAIEAALRRCHGRLVDVARELDVSRVTLYRLMQRYGLRDDGGQGEVASVTPITPLIAVPGGRRASDGRPAPAADRRRTRGLSIA